MMFRCASHAPADQGGAGQQVSNGSKTLVVDIHCHRECQPAKEMMAVEAERTGFAPLSAGNEVTKEVNQAQLKTIAPKMTSIEERLADMDQMGVDIQAVSIAPYQYYYWAEPEIGRTVSQMENDELAEVVAGNPDRFVALGTVPLQEPEFAVTELTRCIKELGFRGVEINSQVGGKELSDPALEPFFATAEELGILIFIHPAGFTHPQRFGEHYLLNLIGHPLESTLAIGHLIFDGVLDRHPGLKICVAHGGGYAPAYAGRMDHGHAARADCRVNISEPPSSYLKRLYFDTMVFEPDQLEFLIKKYGADHILLGTDYPYDMGDYDPLGLVGAVGSIDDDARSAVCGLNAAGLLGIPT